jgi:hypothetical protein
VKGRGFLDDGLERCAGIELAVDFRLVVEEKLLGRSQTLGQAVHRLLALLLVADAAECERGEQARPCDVAAVRATSLGLPRTQAGRMPALRLASIRDALSIGAFGALIPLVHSTPYFSPGSDTLGPLLGDGSFF